MAQDSRSASLSLPPLFVSPLPLSLSLNQPLSLRPPFSLYPLPPSPLFASPIFPTPSQALQPRNAKAGPPDGWQWEDRRKPLWKNLLPCIIEQHAAATEVCVTNDLKLNITTATNITPTQTDSADNGNKRQRTEDQGLSSLVPLTRARDDILYHTWMQWAKHGRFGYANIQPASDGRQIWVGDTFTYPLEMKLSPKTRLLRITKRTKDMPLSSLELLLLPINLDDIHWILVRVWVKLGLVQVVDSLGGMNRKVVGRVVRWLHTWQEVHKRERMEWRTEYCSTGRQLNGVDCGLFLTADAICTPDGVEQLLSQSGVNRFRKWLTHRLWSAGGLAVSMESIQVQAGQRPTLQSEMPVDEWVEDTVAVTYHPISPVLDELELEFSSDEEEGKVDRNPEVYEIRSPSNPPAAPTAREEQAAESSAWASRGLPDGSWDRTRQTKRHNQPGKRTGGGGGGGGGRGGGGGGGRAIPFPLYGHGFPKGKLFQLRFNSTKSL